MNNEESDSKLKIGLALGSGGVRGGAHFGVIRTLLKYGVKFHCIAGSSSGSIIGAALAADRLNQVEEYFRRMNWWKAFHLFTEISWPFNGGWLTGKRIKEALREQLGTISFEKCKIPFTAVALDMMNGKEVPIQTGDLVDGTFASMAVQGLFKPVLFKDRWIGDGGLQNPLPIQTCRDMGADIVIAVDVNLGHPLNANCNPYRLPSLATIFKQSCRIIQNNWTGRILRSNPPDILIQPDLHEIARWNLRDMTRAILRGKIAAEKTIASISPALRYRMGLLK